MAAALRRTCAEGPASQGHAEPVTDCLALGQALEVESKFVLAPSPSP